MGCTFSKLARLSRRIVVVMWLVCTHVVMAQPYDFWRPMLHPEAMTDTLPGTVRHFSSYDRNGGNNDLGYYYGTDANGWKLLCDATGPGVLTEFWWTKQGASDAWMCRIYINDTLAPVVEVPLNQLCGGLEPFVWPLADSTAGGNYSYLPIPFQNRLRITYSGQSAIYYHATVRSYPPGTIVENFTMPPSDTYLAKRDSLAARFITPETPAYQEWPYSSESHSLQIPAHSTQELLNYTGRGTCRRMFLGIADHAQATLENVWVKVYTDSYPFPDLEGPISTLFGAALGWRPYRSAVTGMIGDSIYLNLPIPFRSRFKVDVSNETGTSQSVALIAEIVPQTAEEQGPFKLCGIYSEQNPTIAWNPFPVFDIRSAGTYVGMLMDMQAIASNNVLEGDEALSFNGESDPSWRGTGTEDYFNGGYYWTNNDGVVVPSQLAYHGCIRYAGSTAAAYRWHIADAIPFQTRLAMTFEVGPWNNLYGHYRSIAFAYAQLKKWQVRDASGDGISNPHERMRIVGRGLAPGANLNHIQMGIQNLEIVAGEPVVNGDSVLDVTCDAPGDMAAGTYPLWAFVNNQPNLITMAWPHDDTPQLSFRLLRAEQDTFAFAGDTLQITMHGVPEGAEALIRASGVTLPWIGPAPEADSLSRLTGMVMIPAELEAADHVLTASVIALPDAAAEHRLKVRYFCRYEVEALPRTAYQGVRDKTLSVLDYVAPGSNEPWGRNLARRLTGTQTGDFITVSFNLATAGMYQLVYFLGQTGYGVITSIQVDGQAEITNYDTYDSQLDWRWSRTDSLYAPWHILSAGMHDVRFEITGRNAGNTGHWDLVMDQIIVRQPLDSLGMSDVSGVLPGKYELEPCYPNPFNPTTTISFAVPKRANVKVAVYNVLGRQVATLANEPFDAGKHMLRWNCSECASGIYLIKMTSNDFQMVRKAILLR